jgi:hypothetical protein
MAGTSPAMTNRNSTRNETALSFVHERIRKNDSGSHRRLAQGGAGGIEAKHFGVYRLSDEERAPVREGLAQAARGELTADEDVAAFFNRFR